MVKILVIQTSRFGDLLQTTPMLHALRRKYPKASITILSRLNVMDVYKNNPDVDYIELFNIEEFTKRMLDNTSDFFSSYLELRNAVNHLRSKKFDLVINTTHDRFSSILTHLLDTPEVRGMYISTGNGLKIILNGFWFRYLRCAPEFRQIAPFNLVDIYKNTTGGDAGIHNLIYNVSTENMSDSDRILGYNNEQETRYIGFQLGTSTGNRRWPTAYFARLGSMLKQDPRIRIVILGAKGEEDLGKEVTSQLESDSINLVGKTDIPLLSGILKRLSVLVTNDTGTMHLAEAVGTKCVALFFESANPFQTGPYGEGHIICAPDLECFPCPTFTECPKKICLDMIPAEIVCRLVNSILYDGDLNSIKIPEGMRVYESKSNGLGLWDAIPLRNTSLTYQDLTRRAYRHMWLMHSKEERYIDLNHKAKEFEDTLTKELEFWSDSFSITGDLIDNWQKDFREALDPLEKLTNTGLSLINDIVKMSSLVPFNRSGVTRKSEELGKIDNNITNLGKSGTFLSQLTYLFELELGQIEDSDFFVMLNLWKQTYNLLRRRIHLLKNEINMITTIFNGKYV